MAELPPVNQLDERILLNCDIRITVPTTDAGDIFWFFKNLKKFFLGILIFFPGIVFNEQKKRVFYFLLNTARMRIRTLFQS